METAQLSEVVVEQGETRKRATSDRLEKMLLTRMAEKGEMVLTSLAKMMLVARVAAEQE